MKIIKKGNFCDNWEEQRDCPRCGSILLIEEEDISYNVDNSYGAADYFSWTCPVCHKSKTFNNDELPWEVKERVEQRQSAEEKR